MERMNASTSVAVDGSYYGQIVGRNDGDIPSEGSFSEQVHDAYGGGFSLSNHIYNNNSSTSGIPASIEMAFFHIVGGDDFFYGAFCEENYSTSCLYLTPNTLNVSLDAPVPLPAAFPLFATALAGMGLLGWRRKRKALV